jgi:hypothetical protein
MPITEEQAKALEALEKRVSKIAGFPVELTIRGARAFTLSADGDCVDSLENVARNIGGNIDSVLYDTECDLSAVYFTD